MRWLRPLLAALLGLLTITHAHAMEDGASVSAPTPPAIVALANGTVGTDLICSLIELHAAEVGMPPDFFARLIWKESRFDIGAISPVGARGIAQFMPYTAAERGLADPFDLSESIRHSALYLRDLKGDLGSWGLAAAGYNGGPNRVKSWLARGGSLPFETEDYVLSITARPADWFRETGREIEDLSLSHDIPFAQACRALPVTRTRAPMVAEAGGSSEPPPPWGVQVAGHYSNAAANSMYRRMQSQYGAVLADKKPDVLRKRTGHGKRVMFAVRVGAPSRNEAEALCNRLRRAGGACTVLKN